jgi:hypothetical protein
MAEDLRAGPVIVPRPPADHRPARFPRRRLLAGALVVVLAVACVLAIRTRDTATPVRGPAASHRSRSSSSTAAVPATFAAVIGDRTGCQGLAGTDPQLLCPIPEGVVEYTETASVEAAYRHIVGGDDGVGARGEAECANGRTEERAWARPSDPTHAAGRYVCRVVGARAEMWWTVDDAGVLGHAIRHDGDLAALFSWWRQSNEHP